MRNMKLIRLFFGVCFIIGSLFFVSCDKEVKYGTGDWDADKLGNHRCVVSVNSSSEFVQVHLDWRRRDINPEKKNIIVLGENDSIPIKNVYRHRITREYGDLIFEPVQGKGTYYIYYMPNISSGGNYPKVNYPEPVNTFDAEWLERSGIKKDTGLQNISKAKLLEIQSVDKLNSFYPMEQIATASEIKSLLADHEDRDYLIFTEDRKFPIRMVDDIPFKWIKDGPGKDITAEADKGEFYTFQIGIYAIKSDLADINTEFTDLVSGKTVIPKESLNCFNTGGVDWMGEVMNKICQVEKGKIQALWFGINIPEDIKPGKYKGKVSIIPSGFEKQTIDICLKISNTQIVAHGDDEPWRHSRLRWLDSKIAINDNIVDPFIPVTVENNNIKCLGRQLIPGPDGLPSSIQSFFSPEVTDILDSGREILSSGIKLNITDSSGKKLKWKNKGVEFFGNSVGSVNWKAESLSGGLVLLCEAIMEFDGFVGYKLTLKSDSEINLNDVYLDIPFVKDAAKYMMGLGEKGGYRQSDINWKWDINKNQDGAWIGDVNAGIQCSFRDENYRRPLNTNFYLSKPLNMPPSWSNNGKGGIRIFDSGNNTVMLRAYSGKRVIKAGEELHFNFNLLITPFKTIETKNHWKNRYYHSFKPVEEIATTGSTVINVHHANEINPYINYPFLRPEEMKEYIDEAHEKDMKVKIYYTVRELTNRAPELFALRSLGNEILSYGPGGGFSWLQEHLGGNYIAAWFVPPLKDAAIINTGVSRWHNYYLEGLDWLTRNIGIDGLYIDDVAFDRSIMKRVRKILDNNSQGALIDLHSANQFNPRDGFVNSAHLYLEHFPYINRLWFGEYFDYDSKPDFWLIECSGIPFGLMGEMLQGGGNPWRGMVYGMTARLPWSGDPKPVWKVWDDFGIQDSKMSGYWSSDCPVKTGRNDVLATVYKRKDKILISIGSWADTDINIKLKINWQKIGINPAQARIFAPDVENFQQSAEYSVNSKILIPKGKGKLIIVTSN